MHGKVSLQITSSPSKSASQQDEEKLSMLSMNWQVLRSPECSNLSSLRLDVLPMFIDVQVLFGLP